MIKKSIKPEAEPLNVAAFTIKVTEGNVTLRIVKSELGVQILNSKLTDKFCFNVNLDQLDDKRLATWLRVSSCLAKCVKIIEDLKKAGGLPADIKIISPRYGGQIIYGSN